MLWVQPNILFKAVEAILESRPSLDRLEVAGVDCVMSKAVQKLSIIKQILPYPDWSHTECYETMSIRMSKLKKITLPENQEDEVILTLKHIQKCRHFLQHIFEETVEELNFQGTYNFMEYIAYCENFRNYDNIYLRYEFEELNFLVENLKQNIISTQRSFNKILPYLSALNSPCSEQTIVSIMIQSELNKMYSKSNEKARTDQNLYRIQEKANLNEKAIDDLQWEGAKEDMISFEIKHHILRNTSQLQKTFNRWIKKYNNEIEILDVALLQTKSKLDNQREQYDKLLQKFTARQQVVSMWQEEVDTRDRESVVKILRIKAATQIQIWWRSILFRRFIRKRTVFKKLQGGKSTTKRKLKKK